MLLHLGQQLNLEAPFLFSIFILKEVNGLNPACYGCLNPPQSRQFTIDELRADYIIYGHISLPFFFIGQISDHC